MEKFLIQNFQASLWTSVKRENEDFALVLLVAKILAGEEHLVKDASLCGISESGKMAVIFLMNNL